MDENSFPMFSSGKEKEEEKKFSLSPIHSNDPSQDVVLKGILEKLFKRLNKYPLEYQIIMCLIISDTFLTTSNKLQELQNLQEEIQ